MEYLNDKTLSISPSVISKRKKFREAFQKHQKRQSENFKKTQDKLFKYKLLYEYFVSQIETLNSEIERNENYCEEREIRIMKYISFLSENNNNLEREIYNKLYEK